MKAGAGSSINGRPSPASPLAFFSFFGFGALFPFCSAFCSADTASSFTPSTAELTASLTASAMLLLLSSLKHAGRKLYVYSSGESSTAQDDDSERDADAMNRVAGRMSPNQSGGSGPDAKQRPTHTQFQKGPRPRQPTWPWQVHLVGLCGGRIHRRNVGPIGPDFPTSFSVRTFREALEQAHLSRTDHSQHNRNNGISRNSSWRSRRRLRWTWWILCAWRYVAPS